MTTTSRSGQRRERVLEATVAAIAEVGVEALRMTDISERAGMTPGHILYYFGRKDRILIETLRWSEHDLAQKRGSALGSEPDAPSRLRRLVDEYLPAGPADARWNLWLHVGIHPPGDDETLEQLERLVDLWRDDLMRLAQDGIDDGTFVQPPLGLTDYARRGLWFLDGLSLSLLNGSPRVARDEALGIGTSELARPLVP